MMVLRTCIWVTCLSILPFFTAQGGQYDVDVSLYNVGQGLCSLVRCKHRETGKEETMLVDIGSTSYSKEYTYLEEQPSTPQKKKPSEKGKKDRRQSDISASDYNKVTVNVDSVEVNKKVKEFITQMRSQLLKKEGSAQKKKGGNKKKNEEKPLIHVKTVVISHPDIDHYGWIKRLFCEKKDHIDYLILGGLPEHYDVSGRLDFAEWVDTRILDGTRVYFPAIQFEPIQSIGDICNKSKECNQGRLNYAPCIYANPHDSQQYLLREAMPFSFKGEKEDHLSQAFNFGDEVRVYALALNPSHFEFNGQTLRYSESEDDNIDSLVLKIQYGSSSALLTGDATGLTMQKIYACYADFPNFLKVNVFSAAHHGSDSHESNNLKLIEIMQPEFVLISNGRLYNHPAERAYKNFKKSPHLKTVEQHKVLLGPSKKWPEGSVHITESAIFSTLSSGNLFVTLHDKQPQGGELIQLRTQRHGIIQTFNKEAGPEEVAEVEKTIEDETSVKVITKRYAKRTKGKQVGTSN